MRCPSLLSVVITMVIAVACGDGPTHPRHPSSANFSNIPSPAGLTATAVSSAEIDLAWPTPSGQADGFQLFRSSTGATGAFTLTASPPSNATSYSDLQVGASTTYCYKLRSFSNAKRNTTYSAYSSVACATTPARVVRAPLAVDAIPMLSNRVDVRWADSSANETGFRVEVSIDAGSAWRVLTALPANAVAFSDTTPVAEQAVCYRVFALLDTVKSQPSTMDCTTPPAAPTNLVASVPDAQSVWLSWSDNSNVEESYSITRRSSVNPNFEMAVAELAANATSYRDTGLVTGVTYSYRVRPKKDHGFGSASNIAIATPQAAGLPNPPTHLVAAASFMNITLTWQDNSSDEDYFMVEVLQSPTYDWQFNGSAGANSTSAYRQSLSSADQPIEYRIYAVNKNGRSAYSNVDTAWVLNAPTDVNATVVDEHTVDITWTARMSRWGGAVEILRGPTSAGPFTVIATSASSPYRDAGLPSGTYWYIVRFRRDDSVSESVNAFASTATTPPNAPVGLIAYPISSSSILGEWQRVRTNETGYRIEQSADGSSNWTANQTIGPWNQYFTMSAVAEQRLCVRVIAFNAYGDSPPSNVACTVAPAAPTELSATYIDGGVNITWRDNSNVEEGYIIYRSTETDSEWGYDIWETVGQTGANATTFRDTTPRTTSGYAMYSVQPLKDGSTGDASEPVIVYFDVSVPASASIAPPKLVVPHGNKPNGGVRAPGKLRTRAITALPSSRLITGRSTVRVRQP